MKRESLSFRILFETLSRFSCAASAARTHFGMIREEASQLTMTEFQMLLSAKYPEQKGFTRDEYDAIADDYMAKKAKRLALAERAK